MDGNIEENSLKQAKVDFEKNSMPSKGAAQFESTEGVIDPPSPIRRHMKWKMVYTKKTGANKEGEDEGEIHAVTAIPIRPSFPPNPTMSLLSQ